jgi:D-arabinose 1-dehydrogenase-like Zn-dependent alcohol dehydrogenase
LRVVSFPDGTAVMRRTAKTMGFATLRGIRPMVEIHPLEEAEDAFQNMGKAQFRAVLTV